MTVEGARAPDEMLRTDLKEEYYAILEVVSDFDGRLVIVKGWSVTLSLAALSLGFQQQHYALFGLAAITALAFWYLDALLKGHQMRYYARMRDIEVAAHALNRVDLDGIGEMSSPRIDTSWVSTGTTGNTDRRSEPPTRRTAEDVRGMLSRRYVYPHVLLPHVVPVVLGTALFVAATTGSWGLAALEP